MLKHRSTSSLIPLLLPIVFGSACLAQDDPFAVPGRRTAPVEKKSQPSSPIEENEQLKSFRAQLAKIEATYVKMATKNESFLARVEALQKENDLNRLRGAVDDEVKDVFNELQKTIDRQKSSLATLINTNDLLKERIKSLMQSEAESREIAKEATENRNQMHQQLLETLLISEDSVQQELAIKHLIECSEKYDRPPVSISGAKMLRRIAALTKSDSPNVRSRAATCLWLLHPNSARELGFQFGSKWRPLEYSKASAKTVQIYDELDKPVDMAYDESPLKEIIGDIQMDFGISVRLAPEIDAEQLMTYKSVGRPVFQTLSDLLSPKKLGFAIVDEEIRILKETDPALVVNATYNVAGLNSMADFKTEDLLKALEESFSGKDVKFLKIGDFAISAKTTERTQRQIQEKIASLAPSFW